jgi:hypothetical protein
MSIVIEAKQRAKSKMIFQVNRVSGGFDMIISFFSLFVFKRSRLLGVAKANYNRIGRRSSSSSSPRPSAVVVVRVCVFLSYYYRFMRSVCAPLLLLHHHIASRTGVSPFFRRLLGCAP